jgi:hypothetical protein
VRAEAPNLTLAHPAAVARAGEALRAARLRGAGLRAGPQSQPERGDAEDGLSAHDARRVLAVAAYAALEGGRAAVLRPGRRRRLNQLAARLGLRAFDASLIIAIAQDAARHAERPDAADTLDRLSLVGRSAPDRRPGAMRGWGWVLALVWGFALAAAGIVWIVPG